MATTAAGTINRVRDLIPDPVYDGSGNPLPDSNGGLFYASTLYNFLSDGIIRTAELLGWRIVDWTALAATAGLPTYDVDSKWVSISDLLVNKWVLAPLDETLSIYPTTELQSKQPIRYGIHSQTDHLRIFTFPAPNVADPTTTLSANIGTTDSSLQLASTTGFLTDGYVLIDAELIRYESLGTSPTRLLTLTRGVGGTTAASHNQNATITHCSIWVKGVRVPAPVTASSSVIELPSAFIPFLTTYVLARCRGAEQEHQEARALMKDFDNDVLRMKADPFWQNLDPECITPYDSLAIGPLAWGRVIVP
jgi:hypothetical protein